jgi:hypothetical protein
MVGPENVLRPRLSKNSRKPMTASPRLKKMPFSKRFAGEDAAITID